MSDPALPARFGRYTLLEPVGGGGMATVYRATLAGAGGFEKELALKMVRPELASEPQFVDMFLDEARLSALLGHANIVQTFDFGQVEGRWFLAMEFVRGHTLAGLLRVCRARQIPLGPARSLHVIGEVARGLGYAHRLADEKGRHLGLVHRDVSPQNVLISREGEVKLADFGIAKAASRSTATRTGHVRGKCSYMAPEQARGEPLDARADVFALGIVLWECLTSRPLFDGPSDGAVLLQVVQRAIPPPSRFDPAVPPELDELVARMLDRDRARRLADGDAVAQEIAALKLRLVRSPEELDLAAFQRGLSSGTAPLVPAAPQGAEGAGVPAGRAEGWASSGETGERAASEDGRALELEATGVARIRGPATGAPGDGGGRMGRSPPAPEQRQEEAITAGGQAAAGRGASGVAPASGRSRGGLLLLAGTMIVLAAGGWWVGRGISAAPVEPGGEEALPTIALQGGGGIAAVERGPTDGDTVGVRAPSAGLQQGESDRAEGSEEGAVDEEAAAAADPAPKKATEIPGSAPARVSQAQVAAIAEDQTAPATSGKRASVVAGEGATATGGRDPRPHLAAAARAASPPTRQSARQKKGTLVLSSRLGGPVAIAIDGSHRLDLQQRIPRTIELDPGDRELSFRSAAGDLRCRVHLRVLPEVRHTVLLDEHGVSTLEGAERHPLACTDL